MRRTSVKSSLSSCIVFFFFFFQAEDGIRDLTVTGVQTCALPIAPAQLSADRQFSTLPSLAPIVKQLRPTVVNVASRFKPRRIARNQRPPQGRQQRPNPFDNPGDDDDNGQGQEDPMERFFRFFGG